MSADIVPLNAEALVRLEEAGALSGVGLDLSMRPSMTYEQYASIGALLGRATTALRFAAGDWLVFGEEVFGEKAADASELLGMSPEGRMELARVARAIHGAGAGLGSWGTSAPRGELDRAAYAGGTARSGRALGVECQGARGGGP